MKIAITNAYTCRNQGDAAIVLSMLQVLRKRLPNSQVTIFSLHPHQDREFYRKAGTEVQPNPILPRSRTFVLTQFGIWILIAMGARLPKSFERWVPNRVYNELNRSDVHVSCGGAYLNDSWGFSYVVHLFTILVSKLLRKPIILYPQTIGPFEKRLGRGLARFVLNRVDAIFVRDEFSRTYLNSVLGITRPRIYMGADAAFLTRPASAKRVRRNS